MNISRMVLLLGLDRHFRQSTTTHRRNRSKSPPKGHHNHHHHFSPHHQHHFPSSSVRQSRRFSSPQHMRDNFIPKYYYSESESDFVPHHVHQHATRRSRSSPPARPHQHHVTSLHRNNLSNVGDHFGVFHTHDLHEANARRASRRDLADLREQLFVRSTNDLLSARAGPGRAARASGRDLLDQWEASHCEKCNALHTLSHNHRHNHRHSGGSHFHDDIFVPRNGGGRY